MAACGGIAALGLWLAGPRLGPAVARCFDLRQDAAFVVDFGRFFSGATVYQYISGSLPQTGGRLFPLPLLPWDAAVWLLLAGLGWGLCRRLAAHRLVEWCLVVGCGVGLVAFYLLGGPAAIGPNFERYALWLIAPIALLAALAIDQRLIGAERRRRWTMATAIAMAWICLTSFQADFLATFARSGGEGNPTYRTGAVEPKQAAFDLIVAQTEANCSARVLVGEWWNYWPLRYPELATTARQAKCEAADTCHPAALGR